MSKVGNFFVWLNLKIILIIFLSAGSFILTASFANAEYGDIIINKKADAMRKAKVGDVVFPHWFHRIRFRCNVCHEDIFKLKAGSNEMSMESIGDKQETCGKCHNGVIAWGPLECERCHSLEPGWTAGAIQHSKKATPDDLSHTWVNDTVPYAKTIQIGAGDHPLALSKSGLPLDKFGLIDWVGAVKKKIVDPLWNLDPNADITKKQSRKTKILFKSKSDSFPDVIFPHEIHSYWLQCKVCHKTKGGAIFKDEAGANPVSMTDISREKKWCARCHDKVSFPLADCTRCHSHQKGFPLKGKVITRKPKIN